MDIPTTFALPSHISQLMKQQGVTDDLPTSSHPHLSKSIRQIESCPSLKDPSNPLGIERFVFHIWHRRRKSRSSSHWEGSAVVEMSWNNEKVRKKEQDWEFSAAFTRWHFDGTSTFLFSTPLSVLSGSVCVLGVSEWWIELSFNKVVLGNMD